MRARSMLFCLFCLGAATEGTSQEPIDRGSLLVGGNARILGFRDAGNDTREFGFELTPQVGLFVVRGLALTMNTQLGWSWREDSGTRFAWGVGPGATYYVTRMGKFYPYVTARTLAVWSGFRPDADLVDPITFDEKEWTWLAGLGGSLFIARHVALNAELFYSRFHVRIDLDSGSGPQRQRNWSEQYGLQFGVRAFVF